MVIDSKWRGEKRGVVPERLGGWVTSSLLVTFYSCVVPIIYSLSYPAHHSHIILTHTS